jgi:hypothetical protein
MNFNEIVPLNPRLQIDAYKIVAVDLQSDPNEPNESGVIYIHVEYNFDFDEDGCNVFLTVYLKKKTETAACYGSVTIVGRFKPRDDVKDLSRDEYISGLFILYSTIREYIRNVTSPFPYGPVTIATITFGPLEPIKEPIKPKKTKKPAKKPVKRTKNLS